MQITPPPLDEISTSPILPSSEIAPNRERQWSVTSIDSHRIGMIFLALHVAAGLMMLPFVLLVPFLFNYVLNSIPGIGETIPSDFSFLISSTSYGLALVSFFMSLAVAAALGYAFGYSCGWFYQVLVKWSPRHFAIKMTLTENSPDA